MKREVEVEDKNCSDYFKVLHTMLLCGRGGEGRGESNVCVCGVPLC